MSKGMTKKDNQYVWETIGDVIDFLNNDFIHEECSCSQKASAVYKYYVDEDEGPEGFADRLTLDFIQNEVANFEG